MQSGPQRYPGASTAYWYGSKYPGSAMESNVLVWHTTEGTSLPDYSGGSMAPNFTAKPDFAAKRLAWYQHFDFDVSSRALVNAAGGVETNTLNVCQIEIVGTCDPASHARWGSTPHLYTPEMPDWAIRDLAAFAKWAHDQHGVPLSSGLTFKPYPSSYGTNGVRMSFSAWNGFTGHCGHQHVPENDHGDPGAFPMATILAVAKNGTTQEDDMPTADEVAAAVVTKLIAGGGVLENSDLPRIWGVDAIPAARPPHHNPDYFSADGKTLNNITWTASYTQQTQTEGIRETLSRVKDLQSKAGAVALTAEQVAALAAAVVASPSLSEQIAELVAEKLAARLAQ